jgi:hypothetical protein
VRELPHRRVTHTLTLLRHEASEPKSGTVGWVSWFDARYTGQLLSCQSGSDLDYAQGWNCARDTHNLGLYLQALCILWEVLVCSPSA